jgi:hypothetical protein
MMNAACRLGALVALLMLSTACSSPDSFTAPSMVGARLGFPTVVEPARIYLAANSWPQPSRYVLYDDGRFELQYSGINDYRGTYTEANGAFTFEWEGRSAAGPWGATGSLTADALTVRYNLIMQLSDFEDAVYLRQ